MAIAERAESPAGPDRARVTNPYSVLPNWLYPGFVAMVLIAFGIYTFVTVLFFPAARSDPYLSPFNSPLVTVGVIPAGIWVIWAPLLFRATCYYYRKAYFRSFFWHPRSCAVTEPHRGTYRGETAFPWVFNNLHRFFFYVIVLQTLFLLYDLVLAFKFKGHFGVGLGTGIMAVNFLLLGAYTYGCHAFRHLAGGGLDCFSCSARARARFKLWKGVSLLNVRHDRWAWASLFSVWATDVYIRLLVGGVITDPRWVL
jgi:hypothetical protein